MQCTVRLIPAAEPVVFETEKQRHSVVQETVKECITCRLVVENGSCERQAALVCGAVCVDQSCSERRVLVAAWLVSGLPNRRQRGRQLVCRQSTRTRQVW